MFGLPNSYGIILHFTRGSVAQIAIYGVFVKLEYLNTHTMFFRVPPARRGNPSIQMSVQATQSNACENKTPTVSRPVPNYPMDLVRLQFHSIQALCDDVNLARQ